MFSHHHHLPSIILTTIFISIYIPTSRSHNCTNFFHCGENVQRIGYPFYGQDRPAACGLTGFELKCQDSENITTIEISSQTFRVLRIDQNVHTITLARSDLLDDVCPQRFNSTITMDDILFSYAPGAVQFLNLYYSCPFGVGQTPDRNRITCSMDGRDTNGYYLNESSWSNNELRSCDVNVTVPVLRMAEEELMQESGNNISLRELLGEGFPVEYKFDVEACAACQRSSGLCWSGTNTTARTCVCEGDQEIEARACRKSGVHILNHWS